MAVADDLLRRKAEELDLVCDLVEELERAKPDQDAQDLLRRLSAYLTQRREQLAASLGGPGTAAEAAEPGAKASEREGPERDPFADREAFLRMKAWLLEHCPDEFVAFVGGRLVAHHASFDAFVEELRRSHPTEDAYVERVDEAAFEERPPADIGGVCEAWPLEDAPA